MTEKMWWYVRIFGVVLFVIPLIVYILQLNGKASSTWFYISLIAVSTLNFILAVGWYLKNRDRP